MTGCCFSLYWKEVFCFWEWSYLGGVVCVCVSQSKHVWLYCSSQCQEGISSVSTPASFGTRTFPPLSSPAAESKSPEWAVEKMQQCVYPASPLEIADIFQNDNLFFFRVGSGWRANYWKTSVFSNWSSGWSLALHAWQHVYHFWG